VLTIGAVRWHGGCVSGLEQVAQVLPLAAPGLAFGILVRCLHLLERQRRRQHHLRPHHLRLHPPLLHGAAQRGLSGPAVRRILHQEVRVQGDAG